MERYYRRPGGRQRAAKEQQQLREAPKSRQTDEPQGEAGTGTATANRRDTDSSSSDRRQRRSNQQQRQQQTTPVQNETKRQPAQSGATEVHQTVRRMNSTLSRRVNNRIPQTAPAKSQRQMEKTDEEQSCAKC
ncbi:hypothetical protein NPIL_501461 [Nephila pilipes]|uniref:Uncharacterized protein n=1 Tax=Nephila pilipes TaxID=299642 RepID=A0A8X6NEN0_NEPPI|nr:hypothetical protein NPIL_501461 [Nephila pilipes]